MNYQWRHCFIGTLQPTRIDFTNPKVLVFPSGGGLSHVLVHAHDIQRIFNASTQRWPVFRFKFGQAPQTSGTKYAIFYPIIAIKSERRQSGVEYHTEIYK